MIFSDEEGAACRSFIQVVQMTKDRLNRAGVTAPDLRRQSLNGLVGALKRCVDGHREIAAHQKAAAVAPKPAEKKSEEVGPTAAQRYFEKMRKQRAAEEAEEARAEAEVEADQERRRTPNTMQLLISALICKNQETSKAASTEIRTEQHYARREIGRAHV